jgi:hypothetical protein
MAGPRCPSDLARLRTDAPPQRISRGGRDGPRQLSSPHQCAPPGAHPSLTSGFAFDRVCGRAVSRGFIGTYSAFCVRCPIAGWRGACDRYAEVSRSSLRSACRCIGQHWACPMQMPCSTLVCVRVVSGTSRWSRRAATSRFPPMLQRLMGTVPYSNAFTHRRGNTGRIRRSLANGDWERRRVFRLQGRCSDASSSHRRRVLTSNVGEELLDERTSRLCGMRARPSGVTTQLGAVPS